MNAHTPTTACEAYEHEIADLVDGALDETAAQRVRAHLDDCAGCRAWHADYLATDTQLQAALPAPALTSAFDAALKERIQALQANGRDARRAAADAEHDALLANLRRYSRRNALLGVLGAATAAGCAIALVQQLLRHGGAIHAALQGTDEIAVCGGLGALIAVAVIGWTLSRSAIVTPRIGRW